MPQPIADSVADLVGNTPLVRLRVDDDAAEGVRLLAKLESVNPLSSIKDRAALFMLRAAEERGELRPGGTVVEATSGNTGIALAALAAARGHRCVIVLPDSATAERIALLRALGAEVVRTPREAGYQGAIARADEIHTATPGSWFTCQHQNEDNVRAHYETTGPEIWADTGGEGGGRVHDCPGNDEGARGRSGGQGARSPRRRLAPRAPPRHALRRLGLAVADAGSTLPDGSRRGRGRHRRRPAAAGVRRG